MAKKIDLQGSMTLTTARKIKKICKPLEDMGVNFFRYTKLFNDGSRLILTSLPELMRYIYEGGIYDLTWYDNGKPAGAYQAGYSIWAIQALSNSKEQKNYEMSLKSLFNITQGMAYLFKQSQSIELFDFAASDFHIYDIEQRIIKRFMFYFKEQAKEIIRAAHYEKIKVPTTKEYQVPSNFNQESLIKSMPIKKYYLNGKLEGIALTQREVDCINWCIRGKTTEEIALLLKVSKKTIEHHIENIKQKFHCRKQSQLIRIAIQQGIIDDQEHN